MDRKILSFTSAGIIAIMLMSSKTEAQSKYYFSSSAGDDSRTNIQAQNPATPWRTLSKLNSFFKDISPGDSIFFKRGDTFYGSLFINKSGTSTRPIVFAAYGKGPNPAISGFSKISSWTNLGNNIYEATIPNNRKTINCVVINETLQPIGRYPKVTEAGGGYLNFESHSGDGQITDNQLKDVPNWTGGEIVIRKNHWIIDRTDITSHTGSVINFTPVTTFYKLLDRSGYFIQNHPSTLTQNGDWCYDNRSFKMKLWSAKVPTEVKVSTIDTLLIITAQNYIRFSGISFEGANSRALYANEVNSLTINNCSINYSGVAAAQLNQMAGDFHFNDNIVSNSLNNAVSINNRQKGGLCTIRNNIITNTGMIAGMGGKGDGNYVGLIVNSENGAIVEYNTITNTGYVPLNFNGNNILIKNNIIDNYLTVKQDGAGIYTWNGGNPVRVKHNRVIKGNIVSNGQGNAYGTIEGRPSANGIYMDNNVVNVEIIDNTVYNISGWGNHNNSPASVTLKGNTFFNVGNCCSLVRWVDDGTRPENGGQDITNMNIQNNIFFTTSASGGAFRYADRGLNFPAASSIRERISTMGIIDNNYYHLPNELCFNYSYQGDKSGPYVSSPPLSFNSWRSLTGYEKNAKIIPVIPSYKIIKLVSGNLYSNGQFSKNTGGVKSNASSARRTIEWDNTRKIKGRGSLKVSVIEPPASSRDFVLLHAAIGPISSAKNYIIRFSTFSTAENGIVRVSFKKAGSPDKELSTPQLKQFGASLINHEFLIKAPEMDANASWGIDIYQDPGTTYIDNIAIHEAEVTEININDRVRFEVNATKEVKIIELADKYVGADGTHYSGSIVLQPFSSKILILEQN